MTDLALTWLPIEPTEQEREWQRFLEENHQRIINAFVLSPDGIGEPLTSNSHIIASMPLSIIRNPQ